VSPGTGNAAGAAPDLRLGAEIEPFILDPVEFEPMKTMVAILQDPNPIHFDPVAAREAGLDGPLNQGPLNFTWLLECAARAAGGAEHVRKVTARFLGNVYVGQRFVCTGTVIEVDATAGQAVLELNAIADDRPVLQATVLVDAVL
jgi:acyl dehydratase